MSRPPTIAWIGPLDGHLELLDQRGLPARVGILRINTVEEMWAAIKYLCVRGAPAIGVAAAFGMVLAGRTVSKASQAQVLIEKLREAGEYLKTSRPTAVNLEWAVAQMMRVAVANAAIGVRSLQERLLVEAMRLQEEDAATCAEIGRNGAQFIREGMGVLTHCNAGSLATTEHGTALAMLYEAKNRGRNFTVFADETRPLLQGARLTAWELQEAGIDVTVICDSMAALVMAQKKVQLVVVGADRIAANGDTANKVGTYSVATAAAAHGVGFVVAAPASTFDLSLKDGAGIPIEERDAKEISEGFGQRTVPEGVKIYNPAFDVTPAKLIQAIVTERGVIMPVTAENVRRVVG